MPVASPERREVELLLCCARTQLGPEVADRIRSLAGRDIDWACVAEMARSNGVTNAALSQRLGHLRGCCSCGHPERLCEALPYQQHPQPVPDGGAAGDPRGA